MTVVVVELVLLFEGNGFHNIRSCSVDSITEMTPFSVHINLLSNSNSLLDQVNLYILHVQSIERSDALRPQRDIIWRIILEISRRWSDWHSALHMVLMTLTSRLSLCLT